jgi:tRNA-2-methylthio-N6-dimethylallyladenosine synthase
LQALQSLLLTQQNAFNTSCNGKTFSVLFEKPGRHEGQAIGRSPYLQPVYVEGAAHLIGQIRDVRIEGVGPNSLKGALLHAEAALA